jgi:hypothetical protein
MSTQALLPTKKRTPSLTLANAKGFVYGPVKVGKTTLGASLADDALILATEPGFGAVEAYVVEVDSWDKFRSVAAEIAETGGFSMLVIDTVDELYRMCSARVCETHGVKHPGDVDYGKVWAAIDDEFRLRIGKLTSLGVGVWFISHSKEVEIKTRVGSITKTVPTLRGQAMKFLNEFCDFILLATSELGPDGEERVLHTAATENYEAGGRYALDDPIPLEADALREAIEKATKAVNGASASKSTTSKAGAK